MHLWKSWARKGAETLRGDAAFYTFSSAAKAGVQFIISFVTVRYVLPAELGLWTSLSLATTYSIFLQAGVVNGLSRELPFNLGAGRQDLVEAHAGVAQAVIYWGMILVAVAGSIASVGWGWGNPTLGVSIFAVTLVTLLTLYQNYLLVTFRSNHAFRALGKAQLWSAGVMLAFIPALVLWGYWGMVGKVVLSTGLLVVLLHLARPLRVPARWDGKAFWELMKVGTPIFVLAYLFAVAGTADRLILLRTGGVEQVGFYAMALYAWQALTVLPHSLATYIYPRMTYSWGKAGDPRQLWNGAWKTALVMLGIMVPMAVVGWFLLPIVGPTFFPKYREGIFAAQITLVSAVFYGAVIGVNALWSMKAWKYMVVYQLSSAGLLVAGPLAGAKLFQSPLTGVATGMLFARAVTFMIGMGATYRATHLSPRAPLG